MDFSSYLQLVNAFLIIIITIAGAKYIKIKHKLGELATLINDLYDALKDDKITKEEALKILEDIKALLSR